MVALPGSSSAFPTIDFPEIDAMARAFSRLLYQFRKSPVLISVLEAIIEELQELQDAIRDTMRLRTIALAQGETLDALGRIVGQERGLANFSTISWFTPDSISKTVDKAPAWVLGGRLGGNVLADDSIYRSLIEGKVLRNFVQCGSVPEIQAFISTCFGVDSSIVIINTLTIDIVVSDTTSDNVIELLKRRVDVNNSESVYFLPVPAGVYISSVKRVSEYGT